MKIMKSGALTAFAALALMASHGVYAAPKGRSLSAMSRILGLAKTHPKKSIFFGALGALSSYALYRRATAARRNMMSALDIAIKKANDASHQCARLNSLIAPLKTLKESLKRQGNLNKNAIRAILLAIISVNSIELIGYKKYKNAEFSEYNAANSIKNLHEAAKQGAPNTETNALISAVKNLMEKELNDALLEIDRYVHKYKDLSIALKDFKDYCQSVDAENTDHMVSAIYATKLLKSLLSKREGPQVFTEINKINTIISKLRCGGRASRLDETLIEKLESIQRIVNLKTSSSNKV